MSLSAVHFPASLRLLRVPLWLCPAFGIAVVTLGFAGSKSWLGSHLSADMADAIAALMGMLLALACACFDAMIDPAVPKGEEVSARNEVWRRCTLYLLSQLVAAPLVALLMIGLARWSVWLFP